MGTPGCEDVEEFLTLATNAILHARGVYNEALFQRKRYRAISVHVCVQEELSAYIREAVQRCSAWILSGQLSKFVVAIKGRASQRVLESYGFCLLPLDGAASQDGDKLADEEALMKTLLRIARLGDKLPPLPADLCFGIYYATTSGAKGSAKLAECDAALVELSAEGALGPQVYAIHNADFSTIRLALQVTHRPDGF